MEALLLAGVVGLLVVFLLSIKISRQPFWGLLALIFFLPFERIPTLELAGFTLKINHIVGGLLIVFTFFDLAFNNRKVRPNPTAIPIILLIISFILSFVGSGLGLRSITFFVLDLFVIGLYLVTAQLVDSPSKLDKINKVFISSSWLIVIYGFYQFFGDLAGLPTGLDPGYTKEIFGFPRVQAFSKEPLYLGNYLLIPLSLGFAQYLARIKNKELRIKHGWSLPLLLGLTVIFVLTLSRGAYLGAIGSFLVFALFYARRVFTIRNFTVATAGLLATIMIVGVIFTQLGPESKQKFLAHVTVQDFGHSESTTGRLIAFQKAIDAWQQSPWVGIGLGNYGLYTANYDPDKPQVADIVNNQYLELLAETGIFGLGAFVLLLLVMVWQFLRALGQATDELRPWLVGLFAALVGTLIQYNFFSTVAIMHIWVLLGLLTAASLIANKRE